MRTLLSMALALALVGRCAADEGLPLDYTPSQPSPLAAEATSGDVQYLPRFWAEVDFLMVWAKSAPIPNLITTGPVGVVGPNGFPGTIGPASTAVLIGGENIAFNPGVGFRATLGSWIDDGSCYGVEGTYFRVEERGESRSVSSTGLPGSQPLSVPFFNAALQQESSIGVAFARDNNPFAGSAGLSVSSRVQGAEANVVCKIYERPRSRLDALVGFRWVGLDENLTLETRSNVVGQDGIFRTTDAFRCSNDFYGAQVGLREQVYFGRLYFRATGKVALGSVHQLTRAEGSLVTGEFVGLNGVPQRFAGGYLVLPSNTGRFATDRFAWAPEATLGAGVHLCSWLRLSVSATVLYLSTVARPGDQIDRVINPTQGPAFTGDPNSVLQGPARPSYQGRSNEYFMQGFNVGAEVRF